MLLMALPKAHAPGKLDAGPGPIDMMDMPIHGMDPYAI